MTIENYKPKINPRNKFYADKIKKFSEKYSIVGVLDVEGLPAPQFQRIRASIKKNAEVLIVKRNIIELTLNELESKYSGISELVKKATGVVGLVFTNDNPFTLFKFVQKNKSSAPAKAGAVAPKDIIVPAGPTSFSPGPIIGELGAFKIKAGINAGKVEIKEDSLVAKEGDEISEGLAGILTRLGIEPMEVGLNIKAIYEEGTIYGRDVLDVDSDAILENLKGAASESFHLALGLSYATSETVPVLLGQGARESLALGLEIAHPAAETIKQLLAKADSQGNGVAMSLPEDVRPAGARAVTAAPVAAASNDASANEESKKEEKEAVPEADAAAGLGGLF